jgi:ATP-binding cassette, subfamily B, bacterial
MLKNLHTEIPNTPFKFIIFAVKPYWKWLILAILFVFIYNLLGNLQSVTFKGFIDSANIYTSGENGSLKTVFLWVVAYPVLNLSAAGFVRASGFVLNYLTVHARTATVKILFEYLSMHSLSYFNNRFSGALSNKVNIVSRNVSKLLHQLVWSILGLIFTYIISIAILSSANITLSIIFATGLILLIPINLLLTRPQILLSEKMVETAAKLSGQVIDAVTNISAVQQYTRREHEIDRLDVAIEEHRVADLKSDNYRERVLAINSILVVAFVAGIIFWAFFLWSTNEMTLGEFTMIVTLTSSLIFSLTYIGQNLNSIMEGYGEIKNGLNEIIRPHGITDKPEAKNLSTKNGRVEFNNVEFHYDDDPRKVLENFFLNAENGEKIGIVGTSGAGKTTLVKLLLRQHDILRGKISIDGNDIRNITQESLRKHISVVPQEPMLFHRTIRENIMYGKLDASEEKMIEVAKKAQAHNFIETLPKKYDSLVGERGVKLSVGQRQRVAIARAFLKNAPILVLDEATSALDSESEVAVQKALQNLMEGKTVFAIAHRLSTLREMDRILVFKDGKIVEDGTHRALLRDKGSVYASLWHHQAGGFLKDNDE